jgi:hypothetical protein
MCVRVYNLDTKEETDSTVEFADMLGVATSALPVDNAYNQLIPEACLCQVDIKKACNTYGFHYKEDDHDNGDITISKKTAEDVMQEVLKHR